MSGHNWLSLIQEWINKTLKITDAQSAPIIVTLLVFITGWLITYISSLISNILARKATRQQFYVLVEHLAVGTVKQAEEYIESADSFNLEGLKPFRFGVIDLYQYSILKAIGYEKVYGAFFLGMENWLVLRSARKKARIKAFHLCWRAIDGIPSWQEKATTDSKFVRDYYNSHNEKRNEQLTTLEKLIYEKYMGIIGTAQNTVAHSYMNALMMIKNKVNKQPNPNSPIVVHEQLVMPGLELSESNTWPGAQELRYSFMEAFLTFENMRNMIKVYKGQFQTYSNQLKIYASDLIDAKDTLKSLFPRKIVKLEEEKI
jgi:hypothetical protein